MPKPLKVEDVTTRDLSTQRFHRRLQVEIDGRTRTFVQEGCNTDQSGAWERLDIRGGRADRGDGIPVGTPSEYVCDNCFGAGPDEA